MTGKKAEKDVRRTLRRPVLGPKMASNRRRRHRNRQNFRSKIELERVSHPGRSKDRFGTVPGGGHTLLATAGEIHPACKGESPHRLLSATRCQVEMGSVPPGGGSGPCICHENTINPSKFVIFLLVPSLKRGRCPGEEVLGHVYVMKIQQIRINS